MDLLTWRTARASFWWSFVTWYEDVAASHGSPANHSMQRTALSAAAEFGRYFGRVENPTSTPQSPPTSMHLTANVFVPSRIRAACASSRAGSRFNALLAGREQVSE